MAVAIVGTPQTGVDLFNSTGLAYTAESGSDRIVLLAGGWRAASARNLTALGWGAASMTTSEHDYNGSGTASFYGYTKETLASGSQNFSRTFSSSVLGSLAVAFTLSGVDQTNPIRSDTSADDTTNGDPVVGPTGISVVAGDLVVAIYAGACSGTENFTISGYTRQYRAAIEGANGITVFTKAISVDGTENVSMSTAGYNYAGSLQVVVIKSAGASAVINKLSGPFGGPFRKLI